VNRLLDNDADPSGYARRQSLDDEPADREISLGMPTILGIFFALALICAVFFGAGYTMGRKSAQTVAVPAEAPLTATTGSPKPTAGSPAASPAATPVSLPSSAVVVPNGPTPAAPPQPAAKSTANPADAMIVGDKPPAAVVQPATYNPQPGTSFMVQVAAVSSQDVADIELAALQKKGYAVVIHHEPQDQLLHIQIGPFATRKDADAMRARVLADGFNAIVK